MRSFTIVQAQMGPDQVSIIQNSGVSALLGGGVSVLKSTEIHSRPSKLSAILQVSAIEGCPSSGVPLYSISLTKSFYCSKLS